MRQRQVKGRTRGTTPLPLRRFRTLAVSITLVALAVIGAFVFIFRRQPVATHLQSAIPLSTSPAISNSAAARRTTQHAQKDEALSALVNRGNELLAQGKPAEAIEILAEAAQTNPEDEDVHYDLGLALTRLGKFEEAIQQYREALRIFPEYVEALNNLGNVLMRTGRRDEAIPHFESALKIMPDYAAAHNNLGTALQKLGRTKDALLHFRQAAKLNPDYWEAHFNVATACLQQGELVEARNEFETVLRLRPNFPPAQSALAGLEARQSTNPPPGH